MAPSWLEAHASYIASHSSTNDKLLFERYAGSDALLKVPIIPAENLKDSSLVTLEIVVSLDEQIGKEGDSDPRFGVSDGVSFIGFEAVDKYSYSDWSPCYGVEATSNISWAYERIINEHDSQTPVPIYTGQFVITLKLNKHWGSCSQAHDGGFVRTASYKKELQLSKGLTLEVYRDRSEKVGIKFIEVTVIDHS